MFLAVLFLLNTTKTQPQQELRPLRQANCGAYFSVVPREKVTVIRYEYEKKVDVPGASSIVSLGFKDQQRVDVVLDTTKRRPTIEHYSASDGLRMRIRISPVDYKKAPCLPDIFD